MTIHFMLKRLIDIYIYLYMYTDIDRYIYMIRECFLSFKAHYSLNFLALRRISYTIRSGHL